MTATITSPYIPNILTQAGAHAWMQKVHDLLVGAGLTPVYDAALYDARAGTLDTQIPNSLGSDSNWMVFNFSDSHQATKPLTVWIKMTAQYFYDTAAAFKYLFEYRVSRGYDVGFTPPSGAGTFTGTSSYGNVNWSGNYSLNPSNAKDFVNYSGDALTVIILFNGLSATYIGAHAALFFHVERQRNQDGSVSPGFVIEHKETLPSGYDTRRSAPYVIQANPAGTAFVYEPQTNFLTATAPGRLRAENSAVIVYPIAYISLDEYLTTFRKVWVAPKEFFSNGVTYTLNFQGEEKTYLAIWPTNTGQSDPGSPNISMSAPWNYAYLYEWE